MPKKEKFPSDNLALQSRIGGVVKAYRQLLGITQEELAWRADMHRTYIADIERGARNITLRSITNLASALQLTVENLLRHSTPSVTTASGTPFGAAGPLGEVILVEDDPSDVEMTMRAFQLAHFTNPVHVFGDGEEVLEYLFGEGRYAGQAIEMPPLVLLDLDLPKTSGLEVLRLLKQRPQTAAIPIVILSGSRHDQNIIECGRLGAENYLIKPVSLDNFNAITRRMNLHWALVTPSAAADPS